MLLHCNFLIITYNAKRIFSNVCDNLFAGSGESLNKTAVNSVRHVGVPTGGASSDFDVDLDAIAATMQGHSTGMLFTLF